MADTSFYIAPACWYFKNRDKIFGVTVRKNVIDEYDLKRNRKKLTVYFTTDSYSKLNQVYGTRLDSDVVHKKRSPRYHESKVYNYTKPKDAMFTDNRKSNTFKKQLRNIEKIYSVTSFNTYDPDIKFTVNSKSKSCHQISVNPTGKTNLVVNTMSNCPNSICFYTNSNPYSKFKYKVYRCQLNTQEESCCCSCNSDAMFEVMKSLYDCYKKKNCDNCNCILCGHLPREERRLGELRKSGKSPAEKEKSFREMAMAGTPLPEGKTKSEKDLIKKVRTELGLPQEPITSAQKKKMSEAYKAGLIKPLEGKTTAEKEKILSKQAELGIPLPEGRTLSEKALIEKIKASEIPKARIPSTKLREAKAAGLLTPLEGKSKKQKEKILRGLAMQGLPLPEAKTASDQKLIDRVRAEVGLPPEPKTPSTKEKYNRAMAAGIITPLEGKPISEKENILREQAKMGLQLPEGRTPSEKALIARIKETVRPEKEVRIPSEKLRKAKAAGLLTPLAGKSKEQKEKILRGLAMQGIPLPEAKTSSEQKLMDQVRAEVGLPPEPKTPSAKEKYNRAMAAGLITPLEGKSIGKKEKILRDQAKMGLPLPEGRTPSEKALIAQIKETVRPEKEVRIPSEKLRKAKAAGLLTPLAGKSKEQKEKILRGLAMQGIPLPEAKTSSEQKLMDKVRAEVGLPPEPKTPSAKEKYNRAMAAGLITPLEGKSIGKKEKILRDQAKMGLPLPEGRTPSEKALIAQIKETVRPESVVPIPSEKLRKAKAAGLLTPLQGKPKEQKEKILKDLAMQGIPFPEPKSASEQKLMDRVRTEVGLPPEPKTQSAKEKYNRAMADGLITPLEGKSAAEKEEILRGQAKLGLALPEGRTPSEKALIEKVRKTTKPVAEMPAGRPALPPEKLKKLDAQTAKIMKEKKGPSDECICDLLTPESERKPLGISVIKPDKIPSEKLRKAKAAGLLTPLQGKSKEQKEKILKGLAMQGLPLPEAKTASEQKLIDQVRTEVGLPPEPKTPSAKEKYNKAMAAGLITPLEGKSIGKKERILRDQAKMGLPLPEGRTPSEKALIAQIKETVRPEKEVRIPSEKLRKAKAAGLLTPLAGKSKEQKEKILRGLAMQGIPLPEAKTSSEQKLMDQVRAEVGLPPEPKTPSAKEKYNRAMAAGLITPLEGKSIGKKEKILRDQAKMGLPLPEGRTPSEKALIAQIKETVRPEKEVRIPSEKLRKAKAAGLLTPLAGKSKEQKEKILRGLAMQGIPLPEAKTSSEQKLMDQVRAEVGLPPEPKTPSAKEKYNRAMAAGLITPLEGKSIGKKEKILRDQAKMGLPLPEGRTPSEKALIAQIKETVRPEKEVRIPSEKLRKAKAAGLLTPLAGKSKEQKEKILRGLAMQGIPLPEAKTSSEQKLMDKVRAEVGLPPEPKTPSAKEKYNRAMAAGLITPLEGKSIGKKEKILRDQAKMGLPLPEGRTPSEKALIAQIKETVRPESVVRIPSEKLRKAKAAGLLTPLQGKPKEQKEKILKGLAMQGIPFPEAKTASEQKLMNRVRAEVGLPPEPKTPSAKEKYNRAMAAGLITPLEGKSASKKEEILRGQAKLGLPLPEGRTPSEKALIEKVRKTTKPVAEMPAGRPALPPEKLKKLDAQTAKIMKEKKGPSDECICDLLTPESERKPLGISVIKPDKIPSEKLRKAKAAGLLTPLQGKSKEQKEKILKGLAMQGLPLPEAKTASEQKLIDQVRTEVGLPPEPKTPSAKEKYNKAMAAGLITPLEGKSIGKKERILRDQAKMGLPLPEGRTPSEKALIAQIKETVRPEKEVRIPSEKLRKAKAAGLLTPLQGKPKEQKEQILKGLAMQGIPFPEAKTASEQKLMDRVRTEVGLPPEPKTPSAKEKYNRAMAAGLITPLEGKSIGKKEKILRDQAKMGLPLPEGRTPSEKALIAQIKETVRPEKEVRIPSEKLRKAKAAGLLTPLAGKSKEQKEKILRGLAMQGIPLPEAKTSSEQKLMDQVRAEVGLPPEPKTPSAKEKYNRAMAAGLITPLEGKSIGKKERILRDQAKMGLPLPEGRTPSEKALIAQIKETVRPESVVRVPSEKLRKAKAAGLLTPLEGKSKEQKEKILKALAMQGIPLPEAKTTSDQKLMDRIRAEVGLPPEPKTPSIREKYKKAMAAGLITPLEGKSASKKEEILHGQAKLGLPLPEGRTPSEKALIEKVRKTTKPVAEMPAGRPALPPEKLKKLDAQTAKIMKEKKGPSDECICDLLTPESERKVIKPYKIPSEKLRKAKAAGLLTPLQGKSKEQKEKILKGLAMQGLPLPEAKTASEQKLIDRVRTEVGLPPEPKTPSAKEKYNRAMAAGLITPLEGKSSGKKEEILRGQAKMGLPLPEGRTASEKALIAKIKETTSIASSVVPIPSEKLRKAKAAGLLTPLQGKSTEKKEKILSGLAEAGLPLPKGKTPSEKSLIRKVQTRYGIPSKARTASEREILKKAKAEGLLTPLEGKTPAQKEKILKGLAEAGLPMPEGTTPSEKALIKEIRTKAGLPPEATPSEKRKIRKKSKKIGVSKSKGGIVEEFEDITKITTCDRGCGCDKKKIRFKHSYVKIRVTSPDISSLCPCPEECVPGVKGGVFTDNEGIKVTIGRVTGVPSFPSRELLKIKRTLAESDASQNLISCIPNIIDPNDGTISTNYYESFQHLHNYNDIQINNSKFASNSPPQIPVANAKSLKSLDDFHKEDKIIFLKSFTSSYGKPHLLDNDIKEEFYTYSASTSSSIESFYLLKTDSCLNLATSSDTFSVISISITETSSCSDDSIQKDYLNSQYDKIFRTNENYCSTFYTSESTIGAMDVYSTTTDWSSKRLLFNSKKNFYREILLLKAIKSESYQSKHFCNHRHQESLTKYDISSSSEILDTVSRVLSKGISYDSSSLLIIMPTSSDEYEANYNNNSLDYNESTIYIQLSENCTNWNPTSQDLHKSEKTKKISWTSRKAGKSQRVFSTDTTEDRPCCCKNMEENGLQKCSNGIEKRNENFFEAIAQVVSHEAYMNTKHQKKSLEQSPTTMNPILRFCKMPPSGRHKNPTEHPISINDYSCNELNKPRSPDKAKKLLETSTKQSICVPYDDHCKDNIQERRPKPDLTNTSCNCVCAPAEREKSNKMVKYSEENNCCPCSFGIHIKTSQENGVDQLIMKNGKTRIKKNKNILCECPEELHPEFQFDEKDWIDETQIRKMKSDLTQTVSGFKLNVPRKIPEPEMSFEEILKFYAENAKRKYERNEYEHIQPQTKDNASADCKCPPAEGEVEEPPTDSEEPFQGIKFHIGGKGSGSKGLAGILCFQLFEDASLKQAI